MSTATYQLQALGRITPLLERARDRSSRLGRPVLASLTAHLGPAPDYDPCSVIAQPDAFVWEQPQRGFALAGAGHATRLVAAGESRFEDIRGQLKRLLDEAVTLQDSGAALRPAPLAFAGFAFDPSSPGRRRLVRLPGGAGHPAATPRRPQRRPPLLHREPHGRRRHRPHDGPRRPAGRRGAPARAHGLRQRRAHLSPARPRPRRPRLLERQRHRPHVAHRRRRRREGRAGPPRPGRERRPVRRARRPRAPAAALPRAAPSSRCAPAATPASSAPRRRRWSRSAAARCAPTASPARRPAAPRTPKTRRSARRCWPTTRSAASTPSSRAACTNRWRRSASDISQPDEPGLRRIANVQHLHTPIEATTDGPRHVLELVRAPAPHAPPPPACRAKPRWA